MNIYNVTFAILCLILVGCTPNKESAGGSSSGHAQEVQYLRDNWGVVKSIEFVRSRKHSAYFRVTTDKVVFDELDVRNFPGEKLVVGDVIFYQTKMSSNEVNTSYCRNDMCQPSGSCYWWMPCFNRYETIMAGEKSFVE